MDFFNNAYPDSDPSYMSGYSVMPDSSSHTPQRSHSDDEDVLLASSRPKKRAGRVVFKETRHPVYRGVRQRNNNKWVCELREPSKQSRIWLGTYPTAEMAARAHDVAALALRGSAACLNFADSAWRLSVPNSTDPAEIRRAAAEAANAFRPQNLDEYSVSGDGGEEGAAAAMVEEEPISGGDAVAGSYWGGGDGGYGDMEGWKEGPLLSPPHSSTRFDMNWEETDTVADVSLWSFSL